MPANNSNSSVCMSDFALSQISLDIDLFSDLPLPSRLIWCVGMHEDTTHLKRKIVKKRFILICAVTAIVCIGAWPPYSKSGAQSMYTQI